MDLEEADWRGILCLNIGVLVVSKHVQQRNCFFQMKLFSKSNRGDFKAVQVFVVWWENFILYWNLWSTGWKLTTYGISEKSPVIFHKNWDTFES